MIIEGEPVHALCPITSTSDQRNQVYLTDESLVIVRKGRMQSFKKNIIKSVLLRNRLYLIPIIFGGIIAPLGIAALMSNLGDLWLLFMLILTGFVLLYYGFTGGPALTVVTSVKEYDIFIPLVTPQLRSFVSYVSWQLKSSDDYLYLTLTAEEKERMMKDGELATGTRLYLSPEEIGSAEGEHSLRINATDQKVALSFRQDHVDDDVTIILASPVPLEIIQEN